MSLTKTSKYISLILRHKPETIGITLDKNGWANVKDLIKGVNKTHKLDMETLEEIVATDDKQRYSFNADKTLIRANQGHSIDVDVELEEAVPPEYLWHGTGTKYVESIRKTGLIPKSRLYVHMSESYMTAMDTGARHGKPMVFCVKAEDMYKDGYKFYKSANGVWLTKFVPVEYLG
jgi:putative RNA 2'-phosphotransferase